MREDRMRPNTAPQIRTVDALNGRDTGSTTGYFRALSEADEFVNSREQRDEARVRVDELEAEIRELLTENRRLRTLLAGSRHDPGRGPVNDHVAEDNLSFLRRFPDKCCAEVSRNGEAQPCDKPAVAVADGDAESDSWWPVCAHHSRGRRMVTLSDVLKAVTNTTMTDRPGASSQSTAVRSPR